MRKIFAAFSLAVAAIAFSHPADARSSHRKHHHHDRHAAQTEAQSDFTNSAAVSSGRSNLDAAIARHAAANGLPVDLVHRVVMRESRYNPRAYNRSGALGLMQIKHATARGVGYTGPASGLFDAETNLTYAVRYLAGAYKVAGGNANRAVALYQSGYYYAAKRQNMQNILTRTGETPSYAATSVEPWSDPAVTSARGMRSTRVALSDTSAGPITRRPDDM